MKAGGPVSEHEPMATINITPLTDVFLVLLIIFMVTTPLIMTSGLKIKMPRTRALPSLSERDVVIGITSDARYFVNNVEITQARLQGYLKELNLDGKLVVVQADASLSHGTVMKVMDIAKQAGAERLAIATEPASDRDGRKK